MHEFGENKNPFKPFSRFERRTFGEAIMIRAVVTGALGRMGKRIMQRMDAQQGIRLTGALERPGHPQEGGDVGELSGLGSNGVPLSVELGPLLKECDVVIDFTFPAVSLQNIQETSKAGKSIVIGSTGFSEEEKEVIRSCSQNVPNLWAPNMSLGINLLVKILAGATKALGEDYDVEIVEAHHHSKKDSPSGTALRLAEVIAEARGLDPAQSFVHGRQGMIGERAGHEIGLHAVRGGDIVGEHTVMFCGAGERVEFVHKASSRDTFANGAVRAASWIVDQKPGLYSMLDMLGLS